MLGLARYGREPAENEYFSTAARMAMMPTNTDADLDVLAVAYHWLLLHYLHVERRYNEEDCNDRVSATGSDGGRGSSCSSHHYPRLTSLAVNFDGEEDKDYNQQCGGGQTSS